MLYGSTAAIAAALMLAEGGIGPAMAQEIGPRISPTVAAQGNISVPGPTPAPSFEYRSGTLDIVNMNRDAVINWTTFDNAPNGGAQGSAYVDFLPKDTELRFVGNGQSFTAVNRVFTTPDNAGVYRGIAIQGQVTSYLYGDGPGSVGPVAGNIWFFSPGGILATASASFNVGSLLLSTSDIGPITEGGSYRYAELTGVSDPFSSVILQPGARVNLTQPGSGLVIFAPTIEQGGDVFVDGSVLYVSGETGFVTFYNDGFVSGYASQEAQAGNQIRHTGTTGGPASMSDGVEIYDPQTIEFLGGSDVGLLLSGSIGYAPATTVEVLSNGSISLSAGSVRSQGDLALTSNTSVYSPSVSLVAGAGESITSGGDANGGYSLEVDSVDATFGAEAGGLVDFAGNVTFAAPYDRASFSAVAGAAAGNQPGGIVTVGGNLVLDASTGLYGSGGQQGGDVSLSIGDGGSLYVGGELSLLADAYATSDVDGVTFAHGGEATLTMTGAAASLTVGNGLILSAAGRPFYGECECYPPNSGSAAGGYAALTATGGTIDAGYLSVSADAEAFSSGYQSSPGTLLDAAAGTALVDLGDSFADIGNIYLSAEARGAQGAQGENGGSAVAGSALFTKGGGGSLTTYDIGVAADAYGGAGGWASEGAPAGRGGDAEGGVGSVTLGQSSENLGYLFIDVGAYGGAGGAGTEYSGASGAAGGDAQGGSATLWLTGSETQVSSVYEGGISVAAYGGAGGAGEEDYDFVIQSGNGGAGGMATGGSLNIAVADGAEYVSNFSLDTATYGGSGGAGGNGVFGEGGPALPGAGGIGGAATGAQVTLTADGGAIVSDYFELDVRGFGGEGGLHGYDAEGNYTGSAAYGSSTGGSILLETIDNGASRFDFDYTSLLATGDVAGTIAISHGATDPEASMRFESLYVAAYGNTPGATPAFSLFAASNPVVVDGTAEIYADSIALDFTGSGRLQVGGYTALSAYAGDITIGHAGNPGVVSVDSLGPLYVYANGDYLAGAGSVVRSADLVEISANGSLVAADTRGIGLVTLSAQGDATVGDVTSAGGSYYYGDVEIFAGRYNFDGSIGYAPSARATVTGMVTADGQVEIESGGFAEFASGSQILADRSLIVRTGDDIIVAAGASLVSDIDTGADESMYLLAGDINFGPDSGDLIEPITTPLASLVLAGSLDTSGHALHLSGDAIDGTGGAITTGSLYVDVTDAPPMGPFSSDGGLLTPGCFQGSACLGQVIADGDVAIGFDSNNGLVSLRIATLEFTGDSFEATTRQALEIGTEGTPSEITAGTRISLESTDSFVSLATVTLDAPSLEIGAGSFLAAASSSLLSPNDIVLRVGSDIVAGTIGTGGKLDDGSGSPTFQVPGSFIVGSLGYGGGNDMRIVAGGAISVGTADAGSANIDMAAGDTLFLGTSGADTGSIRLDGAAVEFNNLYASGLVYLTAGSGGITGSSPLSPVIDTAGAIGLETSGDVSVSGLVAGGDIGISGAAVTAASLSAGGSLAVGAGDAGYVGSFSSGGDATFTAATLELGNGNAGGNLAALAESGDLTFNALSATGNGVLQASGALSGGDIGVGGTLTLLGGSMGLGNASGAAGISAAVSGDAGFAALTSSGGAIALDAGGNITGDTIDAATNASLTGGIIAVEEITAGADLTVDAFGLGSTTLSAGDDMLLTLEGGAVVDDASAGGDLSLSAGNGITAATLTAGGALAVSSASPASIGEAVAGTDMTIGASILNATSLVAGGAIAIDTPAGAFVTEVVAGSSLTVTGSALTAGTLDAGTTIDVSVALEAAIDSFFSGGDAAFSGRSLDLGNGSVGGALWAGASEGALSFTDLTVTGAATLAATDALSGGDIAAGGLLQLSGDSMTLGSASGATGLVAAIAGEASFTSLISSAGAVSIEGGTISGGTIAAATSASLTGGAVTLESMTAGNALTLAADSLEVGLLDAGGDMTLQVAGDFAAGMVTAGGALDAVVGGAAGLESASAGTDLTFASASLVANSLNAGGALDVAVEGTAALAAFTSGADSTISGGEIDLGTGTVGGDLAVESNVGNLGFFSLDSVGNADLLAAGDIGGGDVAAGGALSLSGANLSLGEAAGHAGLTAGTDGAASFTTLSSSAGAVSLDAGGSVTGGDISAATVASVTGADIVLGTMSAGTDLALGAATLTATSLTAGDALMANIAGAADLSSAEAGGSLTLTAGNLAAESLDAGDALTVTLGTAGTIDSITSGGDAALSATALALGSGDVAGDLSAEARGGALAFSDLVVDGNAALLAAGALSGGDVAAGGTLTLSGASLALGEAWGDAGLLASTDGTASFTALTSSAGSVSLEAGGAVTGGDIAAATAASLTGGDVVLATMTAGTELTLDAASLTATTLTAGGALTASVSGAAELGAAAAGGALTLEAAELTADSLHAGTALSVTLAGAGAIDGFSSGGDATLTGASLTLGNGSSGGDLAAQTDTGSLAFSALVVDGNAELTAAGALIGGDVAAGGTLTLSGASLSLGQASGDAGLAASTGGAASFASLTSDAGAVLLDAGGAVTGGDISAATTASLTGGDVVLGTMSAGTELTLDAASLTATNLTAGGALTASVSGAAELGTASAGTDFSLDGGSLAATSLTAGELLAVTLSDAADLGSATAGGTLTVTATSLAADSLEAGGALTVALGSEGTIGSFASGGDASLTGASLVLGTGEVGGDLDARASEGPLAFTALTAEGDAELTASGSLSGDAVAAGGTLALSGASFALGTGSGAEGVEATSSGAAGFTALASSGGSIALDAGGAVTGGSASAAGSVSVAGANVALDDASFGEGLSLTARSGFLTGSGLYQGTGAVDLEAAQGIAIGSVDTMGAIAMTAGAEARFVELRSRDGSVGVNAGADISGSSVAATGSDPAGDDSVSLVAAGPITLDGAVSTLNPVSRAQDDFTASAGGALAIVRAEAGRDLALSAGAGMLSAANVASGRDLTLTGPAVALAAGSVAHNLTVTATAGHITGSGATTAGGAIDLSASGNIAVGSLTANGGGLEAEAGGSIGFAALEATGTVHAVGLGISGQRIGAGGDIELEGLGELGSQVAITTLDAGGSVDIARPSTVTAETIRAGGDIVSLVYTSFDVTTLSAGRNIDIQSTVGDANVPQPRSITVQTATAGGDLYLGTFGALSVGEAVTTGAGTLFLGSSTSVRADSVTGFGDVVLFGSPTSPSGVTIADGRGGIEVATLSAGGNLTVSNLASGLELGTATVAGNATITLDDPDPQFAGLSVASLSVGGNLAATGAGAMELGTTTVGQWAVLSGGSLSFESVTAGNGLTLESADAVAGGTLAANGFVSVSAGGAIALSGLGASDAELSAGGAIAASGIAVEGLLEARGTALTLASPGALTVEAEATAGGIDITAGGDLTISAAAPGDILLASTGGSVIIGSVGQPDNVFTGIGVQSVDGDGAVSVTAANGISVEDSLSAGGALTMSAGGLIELEGSATGTTVALTARDLAIGSEGTLQGGQRVSLASRSQVMLGSGANGGFAVDQAEFDRIRSGGDLLVSVLSAGEGGNNPLTVGDLAVNAGEGGQIGSAGMLGLSSAGAVEVNGTLSLAQAGTGNTLSLAGDTVDLDYANAVLSVVDTANAPTGRIAIDGRLVTSMSEDAAADIVGKTPEEITVRLGQADLIRETGLFRTSDLTLEGIDAILIQNSGGNPVDDRRGLTVGALTVTGAADGHTLVVLNGVVADQTGVGAAQRVDFTTPIAPGSSFNGCVLANLDACLAVVEPEPPILPPDSIFGTRDLIREDEDSEVEDGVADGKPEAPPIDTHRIDDPAGLPMIDDPVTGAGNEDLWQPPED